MTEHLPIEAAPTLVDVISSPEGERVGRVDFTARRTDPAATEQPPAAGATTEQAPADRQAPAGRPRRASDPVDADPAALPDERRENRGRSARRTQAPPQPPLDPELAGRSLDDIVTSMIRTMARTRDARIAHEEALVAETTRRCELAEAQAALDAELTLLMARRRAHAVVAASGSPQAPDSEETLDHLVDSASRMLHSLGVPGPAAPPHEDGPA